jgi:hypothetical protein
MHARAAAVLKGHDFEEFAVNPALDGPWPGAGPRRNARMLRYGRPTHGLAFGPLWKGRDDVRGMKAWKPTGTGAMVSYMLSAHVPVLWVPAPGVAAQGLGEFPSPPGATT